jgi:hypothetical protein
MSQTRIHSRKILFLGVVASLVMLMSTLVLPRASATTPDDGSVLPFPPTPMASVAKPRLQDSTMKWPDEPQRLPKDTPNILIVMLDKHAFQGHQADGLLLRRYAQSDGRLVAEAYQARQDFGQPR